MQRMYRFSERCCRCGGIPGTRRHGGTSRGITDANPASDSTRAPARSGPAVLVATTVRWLDRIRAAASLRYGDGDDDFVVFDAGTLHRHRATAIEPAGSGSGKDLAVDR